MPGIYLIPDGTKNLSSIFPVNFREVKDYYVQVLDDTNAVVATTPTTVIEGCDTVRLHFLNYAGQYDSVNFPKPRIIHEVNSGEFKKSVSYPLNKTDTGSERFNVSANDTYEVRRPSTEDEMTWLQECLGSTKAFIEWAGIEGQTDNYIPVVILNGKVEKIKLVNDFIYDFIIQFRLANDFKILRN